MQSTMTIPKYLEVLLYIVIDFACQEKRNGTEQNV